MRADVFEQMREIVEDAQDRREKGAWSKLSREARTAWAEENQP